MKKHFKSKINRIKNKKGKPYSNIVLPSEENTEQSTQSFSLLKTRETHELNSLKNYFTK